MAKGRRLTTGRGELLFGGYGYVVNTTETNYDDDCQELREDDVWSMVDGMVHRTDHDWNSHAAVESNTRRSNRNPMPRGSTAVGGLSSAFDDAPGKMVSSSSRRIVHQFPSSDSQHGRHVATSAPVNVPDWSKIYRVDSVESMYDHSDDITDDQDSGMVPPHEYLARANACGRSSAANSVFVGVGRTLKGRDLSRVRDAVWSQTGFDG